APETFADATDLIYVAESDVMGGMGPALHPFSDQAEAQSFIDTHGGQMFGYEAIDRTLIEGIRQSGN
ncbi:NosL family protein, partial [Halorubrum sp. SS7]